MEVDIPADGARSVAMIQHTVRLDYPLGVPRTQELWSLTYHAGIDLPGDAALGFNLRNGALDGTIGWGGGTSGILPLTKTYTSFPGTPPDGIVGTDQAVMLLAFPLDGLDSQPVQSGQVAFDFTPSGVVYTLSPLLLALDQWTGALPLELPLDATALAASWGPLLAAPATPLWTLDLTSWIAEGDAPGSSYARPRRPVVSLDRIDWDAALSAGQLVLRVIPTPTPPTLRYPHEPPLAGDSASAFFELLDPSTDGVTEPGWLARLPTLTVTVGQETVTPEPPVPVYHTAERTLAQYRG